MSKIYVHETEFGKLEAVRRPKWFFDDGSPVSDEFLASEGYFPAVSNFPRHLDRRVWDIICNPVEEWEKSEGYYYKTHSVSMRPIPEIKEQVASSAKLKIDEIREAKLDKGAAFDIEGVSDRVKCSAESMASLTPLRVRAKDLVDAGRGEDKLTLRTQSNAIVRVSAHAVVEITDIAFDYGQTWYEWSWKYKDKVSAVFDGVSKESEVEKAVAEIDDILVEVKESISA